MAKNKMTEEEKIQWLELCEWLEINIFNYDIRVQRLQTKACLVLKGLQTGQNVINKNQETHGNYPFNVILMTFKANKATILKAIKDKDFDNDEAKKMSYICSIVRNKLNAMYSRYLNVQKSQEKVEKVDTEIMSYDGAEYKSNNTERKRNKRLEGLW